MNHAITVGGLLLTLGMIGGALFAAAGLLAAFAGGMSDAPAAGAETSRKGCFFMALGTVLFGASVWGLLS